MTPKFFLLLIIVFCFFIAGYVGYRYTTSNITTLREAPLLRRANLPETATGTYDVHIVKNLTSKDIPAFKEKATFLQSMLFVALKNRNKDLWNGYWSGTYEKIIQPEFSKLEFLDNTSKAYDDIINQQNIDGYSKYLLDGAIIFSSQTIEEKVRKCTITYGGNSKNCINLSNFYEVIRTGNMKYCDQLPDDAASGFMRQNCKELMNSKEL